jgi:hypothetical protein
VVVAAGVPGRRGPVAAAQGRLLGLRPAGAPRGAATNTSGFNCRKVSGASHWSEHAFGRAIDLNPLRNPWRWGGYWSGSRDYQHFSSTGR